MLPFDRRDGLATGGWLPHLFASFVIGDPLAVLDVSAELSVPLLTYDGPVLDVAHPTAAGYAAFTAEIVAGLNEEGFLP